MDIHAEDLLPGEKVLLTKSANALIRIKDYGLSRFFADDLLRLIGMKGIEGIGGKLHLTNYRLLFKAHRINRLTGKFSIALPTILGVKDTSHFIMKRIEVTTVTENFEFVVWDIPELIATIDMAREELTPAKVDELRTAVVENYDKFGNGLKIVKSIEAMNKALLVTRKSGALVKLATDAGSPIELSGILNLIELLGEEAAKEK